MYNNKSNDRAENYRPIALLFIAYKPFWKHYLDLFKIHLGDINWRIIGDEFLMFFHGPKHHALFNTTKTIYQTCI